MAGKEVVGRPGRAAVRLRGSPDEGGTPSGQGASRRLPQFLRGRTSFSAIHHRPGRNLEDRLLVTELTVMYQEQCAPRKEDLC